MDFKKALEIVKDDLLIKYHENDWNKTDLFIYKINNYKFSENFYINIICNIYPTKVIINFPIKDLSDSNVYKTEFFLKKIFKINDDTIEKDFENIILFIHNFKNDFEYSKILGHFISKSIRKREEELYIAKTILAHDKIESCCVCYESNKLFTICDHNLCIECYLNLYKQNPNTKCPMCRKKLNDDEEEDEDDHNNEF